MSPCTLVACLCNICAFRAHAIRYFLASCFPSTCLFVKQSSEVIFALQRSSHKHGHVLLSKQVRTNVKRSTYGISLQQILLQSQAFEGLLCSAHGLPARLDVILIFLHLHLKHSQLRTSTAVQCPTRRVHLPGNIQHSRIVTAITACLQMQRCFIENYELKRT